MFAIDFIKTAIIMGILDFIWLNSTKSIYNRNYRKVQCNRDIVIRWIPALVTYTLMSIGFVTFILPFIKKHQEKHVILKGALFGLVVYGVYNGTCMAVFRDFPLSIAIIDTLWGAFIFAATTFIFVLTIISR